MKYPKTEYVRSRQLLMAVASLPCQHCGRHGMTQAAHANESSMGKGRGIKASDIYTAALCCYCHAELDQGKKWSREERATVWGDAWRKTVRTLLSEGMWPKNVPVPDIRRMN
jgi:hypothetical protein